MSISGDNIPATISEVMEKLGRTETVIGKEFKMGEFTVVPVISVCMGFGMGRGAGDQEKGTDGSGGGGGGIKVQPVAFLVARENEVNLLSINRGKGLETIFESMPNIINVAGKTVKEIVATGIDKAKNADKPDTEA